MASRGSATLSLLQLLSGSQPAQRRYRRTLSGAFRNAGYLPELQAPTRWNWERLQGLRRSGAVRPAAGDNFASPQWVDRIVHRTPQGNQVAWQPAQRLRWTPGMLLPRPVRRAVQGYQNLRTADPAMARRVRQLTGAGAVGTGALGVGGVAAMRKQGDGHATQG